MPTKKLLIANHNPAKFERYTLILSGDSRIKVLGLKDLAIEYQAEETEPDALGNAVKKAREYSRITGMTTLAIDEELFIDALPPDKQPRTNVRRIVGREASDEELLEAVLKLLNGLSLEKRGCVWNFAIAIATSSGRVSTREVKLKEYFGIKPKLPIKRGYPLSSLLYNPDKDKYQVEYTHQEELERLSEVKMAVEELIQEIFSNN